MFQDIMIKEDLEVLVSLKIPIHYIVNINLHKLKVIFFNHALIEMSTETEKKENIFMIDGELLFPLINRSHWLPEELDF